jgi:hypothetical protein
MAGFSERDARDFLQQELGRSAASSQFYWDSDLEELLDLVTDAVAKLVAANNAKLIKDWEQGLARALRALP